MKKVLLTLALMATFSMGVQAENVNMVKHCGVGAMVSPDDGTVAAIVNVLFSPYSSTTTYISSRDMCVTPKAAAAHFIHNTYSSIETDTVSGEGENLTAALTIMGCEESKHAELSASIREGFASDVLSSDYSDLSAVDKTDAYFNMFDSKVSPVCDTI